MQGHPLGFLKGLLIEKIIVWLHQGISNFLLTVLKDMEEIDHFLSYQEADFLFNFNEMISEKRRKNLIHQGVCNVPLDSSKGMEETEHFLRHMHIMSTFKIDFFHYLVFNTKYWFKYSEWK